MFKLLNTVKTEKSILKLNWVRDKYMKGNGANANRMDMGLHITKIVLNMKVNTKMDKQMEKEF